MLSMSSRSQRKRNSCYSLRLVGIQSSLVRTNYTTWDCLIIRVKSVSIPKLGMTMCVSMRQGMREESSGNVRRLRLVHGNKSMWFVRGYEVFGDVEGCCLVHGVYANIESTGAAV